MHVLYVSTVLRKRIAIQERKSTIILKNSNYGEFFSTA